MAGICQPGTKTQRAGHQGRRVRLAAKPDAFYFITIIFLDWRAPSTIS